MKYPKAMLVDLKRSGLGREEAVSLGLEFSEQDGLPCYAFPYPDLDGKATGHFRVRYLGALDELPRDKKKNKPMRYWQPAGSPPRFYLPNIGGVNWPKVAADPAVIIHFTEGEKKAAAVCNVGEPCVGLGGVWNWLTEGQAIDDFNLFAWKGREARIVFDSDIRHKSDVQRARDRLADELIKRGAIPSEVELPDIPGHGKTGIDDFLVRHGGGPKALAKFRALLRRPLLVPEVTSFADLAAKNIPAPKWVIEGLLSEGLTILAGKPKVGKSWATLDISVAAATGGKALGIYDAKRGGVLHLALEDTERRFQDRLKRILDGAAPPANAHFINRWPPVEAHGLIALERWLDKHRDTRLVVIDTFAKVRARQDGKENLYRSDYEAIGNLKRIADDYSVAVLVVHHERKASADDHLDRVSGSTGLTGAADTILTLGRDRGQMDAVLCITGRDVEEQEIALSLDRSTMRWKALGPASDYRMGEERRQIIEALIKLGRPATPTEVADCVGKQRRAANKLLLVMAREGDIVWRPDGTYEARRR